MVPITPNSDVVARPTGTMPEPRTRETSSDWVCATQPSASRLPASVGRPASPWNRSLSSDGDAVKRARYGVRGRLDRIGVKADHRVQLAVYLRGSLHRQLGQPGGCDGTLAHQPGKPERVVGRVFVQSHGRHGTDPQGLQTLKPGPAAPQVEVSPTEALGTLKP